MRSNLDPPKGINPTTYKYLPDKFNLNEIKSFLRPEQIMAIQKIHQLWLLGIPLYIYGSFVPQCGMLLVGKKPLIAKDIDAASFPIAEKELPEIISKLAVHKFKPKELEINPKYIPTFYPFEYEQDKMKIDFMVKLLSYIDGPNALILSTFTLNFSVGESAEDIYFMFDKRKSALEYFCNHVMCQMVTPQIEERGLIRRVLKQINNNRDLYTNNEIYFYFETDKVEKFSIDDKGWKALNDFIKNDFKRKISSRKFMSFYNEMRRMIKEGTFFIPEASSFIKNFCEVILENHYATHWLLRNGVEQEALNMTLILQRFFSENVEQADQFHDVLQHLLYFMGHLKSKDPRMLDVLLRELDAYKSEPPKSFYTPKLFTPRGHKSYWRPVAKEMEVHPLKCGFS